MVGSFANTSEGEISEKENKFKMSRERVEKLIQQRENIRLEFKESQHDLPANLFETICAMLNREGGDILWGVANDGTVTGIEESRVEVLKTNLVNLSNNAQKIDPPFILFPQTYLVNGQTIIHIQAPASSQVHKTGGHVFDRRSDTVRFERRHFEKLNVGFQVLVESNYI